MPIQVDSARALAAARVEALEEALAAAAKRAMEELDRRLEAGRLAEAAVRGSSVAELR